MTPDPRTILEGTGEEVSKYAGAHPNDRFRLVALSTGKKKEPTAKNRIEDALKIIETFRDRIPVLPSEAYSTDSLYD